MRSARIGKLVSCVALAVGALSASEVTMAQGPMLEHPQLDAMFGRAEREGRVGIARKSREVDVRPAVPGEIVKP